MVTVLWLALFPARIVGCGCDGKESGHAEPTDQDRDRIESPIHFDINEEGESLFSGRLEDCIIKLTYDKADRVLRYNASPQDREEDLYPDRSCILTVEKQLPLLSATLHHIYIQSKRAGTGWPIDEFRVDSLNHFEEMARRLSLAAARSASWDASNGRPASDEIQQTVIELAEEDMIYPELVELFGDTYLLTIKVLSMERITVSPVEEIPFRSWLKEQNVSDQAKLPWNCIVRFKVTD